VGIHRRFVGVRLIQVEGVVALWVVVKVESERSGLGFDGDLLVLGQKLDHLIPFAGLEVYSEKKRYQCWAFLLVRIQRSGTLPILLSWHHHSRWLKRTYRWQLSLELLDLH
jgi:hypothetical protein